MYTTKQAKEISFLYITNRIEEIINSIELKEEGKNKDVFLNILQYHLDLIEDKVMHLGAKIKEFQEFTESQKS